MSPTNQPAGNGAMSLRELAAAADVTLGTVYAWSAKGMLPESAFKVDGKLWIPRADADVLIAERRADKQRFFGQNTEPFPPDVETVGLEWLAAQLNVSLRRVWALSAEGALPASVRRIGRSIQMPIDDARAFVEEQRSRRRRPFPRRRQASRATVGLGWLADEIGCPRQSLYYIINIVPLPDSTFYVGNEMRMPREDGENWVADFSASIEADNANGRRLGAALDRSQAA
ncbi:hypothetical protein KK092_07120 [Curtobacterium flaccumfaciens pv. flaccumfaciens]|uniref:hypothetical protein n=1 Tax=Curtobacterium flaccumfaciens TaxID=2035 RepID=UPI001BDEC83B|nr:hypothetical protein [Curtobacterium flaccumfaciens]MBT1669148.1 hypothetical protein [Curtobacterium flaccumfaciens pv. flaccumfaciens]